MLNSASFNALEPLWSSKSYVFLDTFFICCIYFAMMFFGFSKVNIIDMKLEFLKNILSVPTCSGHEQFLADCIMKWCGIVGIKCDKDGAGNLFLTKGSPSKEGFYPCCTSHMDTVHDD